MTKAKKKKTKTKKTQTKKSKAKKTKTKKTKTKKSKAKKTKTKKTKIKKSKAKKTKTKKAPKVKKSRFVNEIILQGTVTGNYKIDIPGIQQISISSKDFEMEIELHKELIALIGEKYDYLFQEKSELFVKLSKNTIKADHAIFLGKCIVYIVRQKYFLGSIGGLRIKLINLTDNIKLFPQNTEIQVALFKSLEDLQK